MDDVYNIVSQMEHLAGQAVTSFVMDNQDDIQASDEDIIAYARARWDEVNPGLPLPFEEDFDANPHPAPKKKKKASKKKASKAEANEVPGPEPDTEADKPATPSTQHVPDVLLSESERVLQSLVEASTEYPDISVGDVLDRRSLLALPKGLARKEYTYKWVDIEDVKSQLTLYGGQWMPVNHTNHPDYNRLVFGPTGGITLKGQLMLCCMPRKFAVAQRDRTSRDFALKADEVVESLNKRYHDPSGREVVVVERTKDPGEIGGEELTTEADYDYGDPADAGAL
jgi:hypothetical protein